MTVRVVVWLIVGVTFAAPTGCAGWRVGEPSPHLAMAQGQITGPAPALLTIEGGAGGWGTVTPLALKDTSTGEEMLVGIFSGRMTAKWLIFHKWVWVIQPWPP